MDVLDLPTDLREVSQLLAGIASTDPSRVAIDEAGIRTSYGELDREVTRVADWLLSRLGPGDHRVGLRIKGAKPLVTAALGISRAGMISVSLDPGYPVKRLEEILVDTEASIVLTDDKEPAPSQYCDFHQLDDCVSEGTRGADPVISGAASIAFTSGSTGTPKGVVTSRLGRLAVVRLMVAMGFSGAHNRIGVICVGSLPQAEPAVTLMVLGGATMVPFDIRTNDFADLAEWLVRERVTGFAVVPTLFRHFISTLPQQQTFTDLKTLAFFGEAVLWSDVEAARKIMGREATVLNAYGCSESGLATLNIIDSGVPIGDGRVPAGKAISGYEVVILDEAGRPRNSGPGEIGVSGSALPLGYWRRPDLDGAVWMTREDGTRLCRTGDVGELMPSGELLHFGRLDHVVKIQGNRVELGEVEAAIAAMPEVAAVAVDARPDPFGDLRLVAYVVAQPGFEPDHYLVRNRLARRIPGYMLPDQLVVLPDLPQLPNGKVDRTALPDRPTSRPESEASPQQAQDTPERFIASAFAETLGLDGVGVDDDFFELGGDSLRAARLLTEIERGLGVDLPVAVMLHSPTVAGLAASVRSHGVEELSPLVPIQVCGSKAPLFVVHHGGGSVLYAREIARYLGDEQPVYGLQPLTDQDQRAAFGDLKKVARTYVDAIRRVRANGPYALFGYSLGGIIAYEMAAQLEAAGETVSFLGLGDAPAPWSVSEMRPAPRPPLTQLRLRIAEATAMSPAQAWQHVRAIARSKYDRVLAPHRARRAISSFDRASAQRNTPTVQERLDQAMRLIYFAIPDWYARSISATPVLYRAEGWQGDPDRGWRSVAAGLRIVDVPGDHGQMVLPPNSKALATAIAGALRSR